MDEQPQTNGDEAGVVLRCPGCADVALVVGVQPQRLVVTWREAYEIAH